MSDFNTYQDENGTYKMLTERMPTPPIQNGINTTNPFASIYDITNYQNLNRELEHTYQRYCQAEANRRYIWNNEVSKYNSLINLNLSIQGVQINV